VGFVFLSSMTIIDKEKMEMLSFIVAEGQRVRQGYGTVWYTFSDSLRTSNQADKNIF
jgi:hypothetical protein